MNSVPPKPRVPFRVFVAAIGTRAITPAGYQSSLAEEINGVLQKVLDSLALQLPGQPHTEIVASPISSGRLGFEESVARSIMGRRAGAQQHFVLPMTQSECLGELATEEDQRAWRGWLATATAVQSIQSEPLEEKFSGELLAEARGEAWLDAGKYIIDHCDLLLVQRCAPHDPEQPYRAALLDYARLKKCPCLITDPASAPGFIAADWEPDWSYSHGLLRKVEDFNQLLAGGDAASLPEGVLFRQWLEGLSASALPDRSRRWLNNCLIPLYAFADQRSCRFRDRFQGVGRWAFGLALLAAATVGFGIAFLGAAPVIFLVEGLILIAILGAINWADRTRSRARWTEYRYLAERLRTAYFLGVTGVEIYPEYVTRKRDAPTHWGKKGEAALRGWSNLVFNQVAAAAPRRPPVDDQAARELAAFIKARWIEDQYGFHRDKAHHAKLWDERLHFLGEGAFYAALAVALLHGVPWLLSLMGALAPLAWLHHHPAMNNLLTLLALVLPASAATVQAIRTLMEYKRLGVQSTGMCNRLQAMREFDLAHLSGERSLVTARSLADTVRQLEKLMLADVQDWRQLITVTGLHKAV